VCIVDVGADTVADSTEAAEEEVHASNRYTSKEEDAAHLFHTYNVFPLFPESPKLDFY